MADSASNSLDPTSLSNGTLTEEQEVIARTIMDKARREIASLDERITRYQAQVELCRTARAEQVALYRRHASVFSCFRRIPSEVLAEIFLWASSDSSWTWEGPHQASYFLQPDIHTPFKSFQHACMRTPLILSQVCRRWRADALREPRLWRRVSLYLQDGITMPEIAVVSAYLLRSKGGGLSIQLLCLDCSMAANELLFVLLRLLVSHSDQWEHLELCLALEHVPDDILPVRKGLPNLKSFRAWAPLGQPETEISISAVTPKLARLQLDHRMTSLFSNSPSAVQWDSLQDIKILQGSTGVWPNTGEILQIIRHASQARRMLLRVHGTENSPCLVTHQNLEILSIEGRCGHLLGRLRLPALTRLEVLQSMLISDLSCGPQSALFMDHALALQTVVLSDCTLGQLTSVMTRCPATHVELLYTLYEGCPIFSSLDTLETIGATSSPARTAPLFPNLTHFTLKLVGGSNFFETISDHLDRNLLLILRLQRSLLQVLQRLGKNVTFHLTPASRFPPSMILVFEQIKELGLDGIKVSLDD